MNIPVSDKYILLTDFENVPPVFSELFSSTGNFRFSEESPLVSLNTLKERIKREGNLSFIRKEIFSFVKQHGYPLVTITDFKSTLNNKDGGESTQILKTLLISFILIMQSADYGGISCNMIILMKQGDYEKYKNTFSQPQKILSLLKTNDDRLNKIIGEYTESSDKFKASFNLLLTNAEQEPSVLKSEIVLFANMVRARERLRKKISGAKTEKPSEPKTEAADAAEIIVRDGEMLYFNSIPDDVMEKITDYQDKEIIISGNFTSFTRLEVLDRIIKTVNIETNGGRLFKKNESLVIKILSDSVIDSTVAITFAQLLSKELKDYKNIRLRIAPKHFRTLQESKGFSMIQRNVVIYEH